MNTQEIENALHEDGFYRFQALEVNEVAYLNTLCSKYLGTAQSDFVSSSHILDWEDSSFINQEIHKILKDKMEKMLPGLELLGGTLATKIKGKSPLNAHKDWTIVDESRFNSYNLWIPLVDTNKNNGTLGLWPGSHLWNEQPRGFSIPDPYDQFTEKIIPIGFEPILNAGEAILYNHKLLHFSRPNRTDQPRNVAIIGMKDKEATLQVSIYDQLKINSYAVTEADFYRFDAAKIMADKPLINTIDQKNHHNQWNEIYQDYFDHLPTKYKNLVEKGNPFTNIWKKLKASFNPAK